MRTNGMGMHKLPLYTFNQYMIKLYSKHINTNHSMKNNQFIEWFVGFSDGESNFTIGLDKRGKKINFNFRFMIGLHRDDKPLLKYILNNLGCGYIQDNNTKYVSYFIITNPYHLKNILFPIFDSFPLNSTKYLDFLSFKKALLIKLSESETSKNNEKTIDNILNIKNNMNNKRSIFTLPYNHINITPYWLLGLIEAEGSFYLRINSLTPVFSLTLTKVQQPLIEAIIIFLKGMLDPYSLIKADSGKLFHLNIEKAKDNTKEKIKFSIFQLDYLVNIFIPFLESLNFKSKKSLDFDDFKIIIMLIYQGKHLIKDVTSYIVQLSYSMNNYRLSTNTDVKKNFNKTCTTDKKLFYYIIEKFLSLPPLFILNDSGQIINSKTSDIVRDVFVIELIKTDNTVEIYPTITDTSISFKVSINTISSLISNGTFLTDKGISKINKIRVYKKL